ncbi:Armadillo-type fold [Cynara cardunculus var. scolymus]|uniref:Nuclear cap-binding protein subunit 1 n=1 Tax=Cynara cardunculus var. scolymus TaxID=59895 RepID=A0A103YJI5_CYNCS|nr:Armadillo-type fold [Cynara cardunculus var. scolymus]
MSSWRSLILRIGEKSSEYGGIIDYKDHIDACFGVVRRELEHSEDEILTFLLQCSEQLPHKIPLYGTVIGLLNLENEELVKKILESTQKSLQDALDTGDCNKIRVLMRFLTVLMCSKVVQPSSLVVVFETLLSSAATIVDDEKGNPSWQARADFYITCILSCLPWGGSELGEQIPEEIERVMVGIEAYLSIRRRVSDVGLSVFEEINKIDKVHVEQDFVEDLWSRIQDLSKNSWKLESVPRPHLLYEAQLVAGKSHDIGPISCPEQPDTPGELSGVSFGRQKHEAELKYPQRIRRLNIFSASKTEDLQPIDRFVVEDRKECAACMVGLPVPFRYEYLMAETIFSQLLLLPQPPFKPIYYTLVIIDLCKSLPGAFPAVVAGAVRALFDRISELDMECRTRLILWFSHHLSNFQFIWPWEEWAYVLELPKWAPQRVFVQEVLDREVRLSYWDKVKQSIENTPALEELLPPKGVPDFRYGSEDDDKTEYTLSTELNGMVKGRKTARDVITWLEESVISVNGLDIALRVVVQTLLDIGSKSFTHLITVLERYGQVIAKICSDEETQITLIAEVGSFWKNSAQSTAITIDRMMGYRLISNLAIVKWVFSSSNVELFHTTDRLWETKEEEVSTRESLESKEALFARALEENEALFLSLYKNFSNVLMERLHETFGEKTLEPTGDSEAMVVDEEDTPAMETDKENGSSKRYHFRFNFFLAVKICVFSTCNFSALSYLCRNAGSGTEYIVEEKEQWCLSTLGYVKAFSRQYASEIWPHMDKLEEEVLTGSVHPLFRNAVYSGLRLHIDQ